MDFPNCPLLTGGLYTHGRRTCVKEQDRMKSRSRRRGGKRAGWGRAVFICRTDLLLEIEGVSL